MYTNTLARSGCVFDLFLVQFPSSVPRVTEETLCHFVSGSSQVLGLMMGDRCRKHKWTHKTQGILSPLQSVDGRPINISFITDLLLKQTHIFILYHPFLLPRSRSFDSPARGSIWFNKLFRFVYDTTLQYVHLFAYLECHLERRQSLLFFP